ncbi:MAG: TonB family protein [Oryzomonas sp.]|jgi:protein TonB
MVNGIKIQNPQIMNAVMVSLTLHALAGWVFLNFARDITNLRVVPPVEFFVVPPPPPTEHMTPVVPQAVPKPVQKNVAAQHRQTPPPTPAAATKPVRENPVVPTLIKQKVEAPPPSLVPPIAASPQAKEPTSLHSVPASAAATTAPASSTPAVSRSAASGNNDTGTVIGPSYGAAYLHNPSPPYPYAAKKLKLQGTVVVRVLVSADGQPKNVVLEKTSGVVVLDETAVETVKHWTFVPARRGNTRIADWVDVPMTFHLK